MRDHNYSVYIVTNRTKKVLYTGMTNDLESRLIEHYLERGKTKTFCGRYFCYYLLYYEGHTEVTDAIDREKEIKGWTRKKKVKLIKSFNPEWRFLNSDIMDWPPEEGVGPRE
jgi:putative endonuclease